MKRINVLLVGLGFVLALASGGLAMVYLQGAGRQPAVAPGVPPRLLVAARDIPEFAAVTADRVALRESPTAKPPEGALVAPEQAVGRIAVAPIRAGEVIVGAKLGEPGVASFAAALPTPAPDEPQRILYAIPATDLLSQSGALGRGDRVDVLASAGPRQATNVILKNILVLGVGRWGASGDVKELAGMPVVYLFLTPQEALVLKHLRDSGGSVELALRVPRDARDTETAPVDNEYLLSQFGVGAP